MISRYELKTELDAKAKELEKEMRLRRNLELNMKRELERVERQGIEKEKVGWIDVVVVVLTSVLMYRDDIQL